MDHIRKTVAEIVTTKREKHYCARCRELFDGPFFWFRDQPYHEACGRPLYDAELKAWQTAVGEGGKNR